MKNNNVKNYLLLNFISNLFLTIIKFFGAIISNSITLLADSIHSLSDLLTDIIAIIGNKFSTLPADEEHPYGHGKYEYITSMIMSFLIMLLGFSMLHNVFTKKITNPNNFALVFLFITFIIKYFISKIIINKGKIFNSTILKTSGTESKYDSFCSLFGIIFVLLNNFSNYIPFLKYSDLIGGIVISAIIFKVGIVFLIDSIKSIIGQDEKDEKIKNLIIKNIKEKKYIHSIKNITLIKYGHYYKCNIVIIINKNIKLRTLINFEKEISSIILNIDNIKYINYSYRID